MVAGLAAALAVAAVLLSAPSARTHQAPPVTADTRAALFVANNWDGTADIVDPHTFERLGRLNVIPDIEERMAEIYTNPVRLGYFLGIRQLVGEGHDQFADDMFSSHDGRFVYISRPSLADVIGMDLRTGEIVWRFPMEGQRSDHMAISPDGTRLLVSDSTANKVHELDTATGKKVGEFESGDSPHENNYSKDGKRVFHASIGLVYTPADRPEMDTTKGERYFQIVDAETNEIIKRLDIGKILEEHGYPGYSSAVRPMAIAPDERIAYLQLSFLHGFVEFDMEAEKPLRIATLPQSEEARNTPRENYLLDSAHHGLAINEEGSKLCVAGTMSDYAAIVHTDTFRHEIIDVGPKPYWSTNSGDGRYCFVSVSGADEVVVIDYEREEEVTRIPVGYHPQRMRMGVIRKEYVPGLPTSSGEPRAPARLQVLRARVRDGRLVMRLRMDARASGRLTGSYRAAGRRRGLRLQVPNRPDAEAGSMTWTVRKRLRGAQARRATGIVDLRFSGNGQLGADRVRLRAAERRPGLRTTRAIIDDQGRLDVAGRVIRRARGKVRVRLAYVANDGTVQTLRYRARIRRGAWRVRTLVPSQARRGGHLSVQYTGDFRRRIGGRQISRQIRP